MMTRACEFIMQIYEIRALWDALIYFMKSTEYE